MPNVLATAALFCWPLVTLIIFRVQPASRAIAISVIAGFLVLPQEPSFNFPALPPIDKNAIIAISVFICALAGRNREAGLPRLLPTSPLLLFCIVLFFISPLGTVLTNSEPVIAGDRIRPSLTFYDAGSMIVNAIVPLGFYLMARKHLSDSRDHKILLKFLCIAAALYAIPALYEVRMSPQLNRTIYGFFPHNWLQHLRNGGYRPLVFLRHGLILGAFLAIGLMATLALLRGSSKVERSRYILIALWLGVTLVLSKNLGATILVIFAAPLLLLTGPRTRTIAAALIATLVLLYPTARSVGIVPTQTIVSTIEDVASEGRSLSLNFRFNSEDLLLERANEKPVFGWGAWGRGMVYDERGRNQTVTDGTWIIAYSETGWAGYVARFGLLAFPLLMLLRKRRELSLETSAIALILAFNLLDLLPNSSLTPITWLMAGSIAGHVERQRTTYRDTEAAVPASDRRRERAAPPVYTRDFSEPAPRPRGAGTARSDAPKARLTQRKRS